MFKSAATRIAHNSTLPALAGNKDLRPLQDLITAEKSIVQSLLKLSSDFVRASEALRTWGLGEGDDLGDTLNGSTTILSHFSSALSKFASHEQAIREHMKAVRGREEALDALRHRRKNVVSKADSAEKKLNKMSPEHKNIQVQTDALNRLQDEIRQLDSEIMTEEAHLGDFKRSSTKTWMSLKFGGLEECCEKGVIVGDAGKTIIAEIPQDETIPGTPRAFYTGQPRTEAAVASAALSVNDVVFSASPSQGRPRASQRRASRDFSVDSSPFADSSLLEPPSFPRAETSSINTDASGMQHNGSPFRPGITTSNLQVNELGAISPHSDAPRMHTYSSAPSLPPISGDAAPSLAMPGTRSGGQFATFPVKGGRLNYGYSGEAGKDSSFSNDVADALNQGSSTDPQVPRVSYDDPVPSYEAIVQSPSGYPSAQAPSEALAPLENPNSGNDHQEEDDSQLPWMEPSRAERRVRFGSRPIEIGTPVLARFRNNEPPSANTEDGASAQPMPTSPPPTEPTPPEPAGNQDEDDEQALNAAAAREVSRELGALSFNSFSSPPPPPPPLLPREPSPPAPLSIPPVREATASPPTSNISPTHPPSPYTRERNRDTGSPTISLRSPIDNISCQIPPVRATSPPASPGARGPLPAPPSILLPANAPPSSAPIGTPYRTPPEYPNVSATGTSPAVSPSPSLAKPPNSIIGTSPSASPTPSFSRANVHPPPPPPSGVRTISAAAFRRPQNRMPSDGSLGPGGGAVADTSPLSVRKRGLPSSPYATRVASGHGSTSSIPQPPAPVQQQRSPSPPAFDDHEDFDYISAYVNSGDGAEDGARARSGSSAGLR
ncbi:hypothetical protein EVG20_g2759 [Dentipellis fragilis]|uniref:Eisosome component PIL1-domain-containing protein n=1 Tax=Dentipellis fragilis TaxID=205917 RepID=A0A4Y9ZA20_9AGAM|nr:hypothetical protein EVG20_g2759 [Dentipellis fragilis]